MEKPSHEECVALKVVEPVSPEKSSGWAFFPSLILAMLLFLTSCGGGGGGGGAKPVAKPVPAIVDKDIPADKSIIFGVDTLELKAFATSDAKKDGVYDIRLYYDSSMSLVYAESANTKPGADGYASWSPKNDFATEGNDHTLGLNHQWWWDYTVTYTTVSVPGSPGKQVTETSAPKTFYLGRKNGGQLVSPRNNGYMDVNLAATPKLSIVNIFSESQVDIKYDFELYADVAATALLAKATGVTPNIGDDYATGPLSVVLQKDQAYYWRARYTVDGTANPWSDMNSFTVRNMCEIRGGSKYAEHVTEWTDDFNCGLLLRTNTAQALGPPNASGFTSQGDPGDGYISIDTSGALGVEMGVTVIDGHGTDIRVWQYVAGEGVELYAAQTEAGPWYSLGWQPCEDPYCDFDLAPSGLRYAKYFRIVDREALQNWAVCYQTSGAEIDSVQALHYTTDPQACGMSQ
jgi:hypothetical protein